jgi:hypothetical protein
VITIGAVAMRFLMATTSEVGSMLPGATDAAGRRILETRADVPTDSWVCEVCRSVNTPAASLCYRGCGSRVEVGRPLPADPRLTGSGGDGAGQ